MFKVTAALAQTVFLIAIIIWLLSTMFYSVYITDMGYFETIRWNFANENDGWFDNRVIDPIMYTFRAPRG